METLPTAFRWETPIRHVTPTDYDHIVLGDACLTVYGSHSPEIKFWCYVLWPPAIRNSNLKHLGIKSLDHITINCLEHATIIFSYNAVLDVIIAPNTLHPPHPKDTHSSRKHHGRFLD